MKISYLKTTFTIEAEEELFLPYFKGSAFRGAFGNAFRKIVCALKRSTCEECFLKPSCLYAHVFETFPQSDDTILNMNKYKSIPHPFIIEPPLENSRRYKCGDKLTFNVTLIGSTIQHLLYFIYTFEQCGKIGIGKGRGKFKLLSVDMDDKNIYTLETKAIKKIASSEVEIREDMQVDSDSKELLKLSFITPARIKHNRKYVSEISFYVLIKSLMLRLNLINYFHCEKKEATWDYKALLEKSKEVQIKEQKTRWWDWERYSSRQKTRMNLGGVIGEITYEGSIKAFLPLLRAGEIFHVGKNTSFGLGKYSIIFHKELDSHLI